MNVPEKAVQLPDVRFGDDRIGKPEKALSRAAVVPCVQDTGENR